MTNIVHLSSEASTTRKRGSIFSAFKFDFNDELESTKQEIEAKEHAMKSTPVEVVREHKMSVAEQVVNDDEQWKKFRDQMRQGGAKTGMQLKNDLDGLLQNRAQELETSGAAVPVPRNRRASLTDFASSLIRGDDGGRPSSNRRASTFVPNGHASMVNGGAKRSPMRPVRRESYQESLGSESGRRLDESDRIDMYE